MMLEAASHIRAPPYLAVTVGPRSHSPPPIAEALITTPGPIMARMFCQVMRGGGRSSPVSQRGMVGEPGWGAVNAAAAWGTVVWASSWSMRERRRDGVTERTDVLPRGRLVCRAGKPETINLR